MNRRQFAALLGGAGAACAPAPEINARPNIVLVMADDLGWGDVAYNGNPVVHTPHLDQASQEGIRFDRFYASSPVCSPTRGSCLTGRHPYRYGIHFAMDGHLRRDEITLAEALKPLGYRTGHFGKWHLGTLDRTGKEQGRWGGWAGEEGEENYLPPWEAGFDVCFSTESKVPTWNPMVTPAREHGGVSAELTPGEPYGTYYWTGEGEVATDNLEGDDSRVIMDRATAFIEESVRAGEPFLAVVWFHTPHLPIVAGPEYAARYADEPGLGPHYFGAIAAMDEQVGRLRSRLRGLDADRDTMLWFASDNGPEGPAQSAERNGSAGPFRGRKRSLYEGGVRVPAWLVWPERVPLPVATRLPCSTLDYYPTILDALGYRAEGQPEPVDGVSLLPLIDGGRMAERPRPIGFETPGQIALSDNRYKLFAKTDKAGKPLQWELYDLLEDPAETHNLASQEPVRVAAMAALLADWRESCRRDESAFAGPSASVLPSA